MRILDFILELLYPKRCIICGEILNYGTKKIMCDNCVQQEKYAEELDYKFMAAKNCHKEAYFDECRCVYYYDYMKYAIEHFKFKGYKNDCKPLGYLMYRYGNERNIFEDIDFMLAVPVHKSRMKERGYNHAFELAKVLQKLSGLKAYNNMLIRERKTKPQYMLNIEDRCKNIEGAFAVENKEMIQNKNIMLIDDIFTTGGTVNECAKVLKENGAKSVYVFELSRSSAID